MSNLLPTASTASATGNPRNKTALKPGHSIMDWIRLRGSGVDLAGTKGVVTPVTLAELKKHNKKNDAWMAIRGKVYNVTRYMDFHPGGIEELMKGVGMDATKVFDEVHAWVNYEQMLNKCYIGPLVMSLGGSSAASLSSPKIVNSSSSSQLSTGSTLAANFRLPFSLSANNFISNSLSPNASGSEEKRKEQAVVVADVPQIIPRFDWIQKTTDLVIVFYTRAFCNPGIILECPEAEGDTSNALEVKLLIENNTFLVKFTLTECVKWPPVSVRSLIETGKVEICLTKAVPKLWSSYGAMELTKLIDIDLSEYEYDVSACRPLNHDSFVLTLKPSGKIFMHLPLGHHFSITGQVGGEEVTRSYTPVPESFIAEKKKSVGCGLTLLIKSYENGKLSKYLCSSLASTLRISPPKGSLSIAKLKSHKRIALLAAGSGLTPFLGVIEQFVNQTNSQLESLSLFYYNKTEQDIWCREQLESIAEKHSQFQFKCILSDVEKTANWDGLRGRVTRDQIISLADANSKGHVTFIGVCGPPQFNRQIVEWLKETGFPDADRHIFQG